MFVALMIRSKTRRRWKKTTNSNQFYQEKRFGIFKFLGGKSFDWRDTIRRLKTKIVSFKCGSKDDFVARDSLLEESPNTKEMMEGIEKRYQSVYNVNLLRERVKVWTEQDGSCPATDTHGHSVVCAQTRQRAEKKKKRHARISRRLLLLSGLS